ncbi:MAG: glycosyltransferase family 4 protein [Verrucomicrobiota bacterium]|jgi:glycosyltransferase involved in cell wall biosynthesis|nr:glycosyltransferase family 4 protein [Verrucomicrobiota bacterium]
MKVCLDIQAALGQRAGVGRYVRELLRHLGADAQTDEVRAFYFDFKRKGLDAPPPGIGLRACRWLPGRAAQKLWKVFRFPPYDWFAGGADVYHFPNFIRPPLSRGRKSVVTIHDVSFLRMPETTEAKNLAWLTSEINRTVEQADRIITDSAFSAREIVQQLKVPPEKVVPIPLGLAPFGPPPSREEVEAVRASLELTRPYLLMVGTIEPRKNIPFLVKVFEALQGFDGELVLVGGLGWKTGPTLRAMAESPQRDRIRLLRHVGDRELSALYAGASVFVFPSRYEGFGFPPLEAMGRGTPVVAARNSSLPEVLGEAPAWVDGFDVDTWAGTLRAVLEDPDRRERMRLAGLAQAQPFTWEKTARRTWAVYRQLAGEA